MHETKNLNPEWLRERVSTMLKAGYTQPRLAVETGVKSPALQRWLEGNGDPDVDSAIAIWCKQVEASAREARPGFVMTPTARSIIAALETARTVPTIAMIYGPAGIGKTETAIYYADQFERHERSRVFYCMCSKSRRSVVGALDMVAEALRAHASAHQARQLEDAIKARLYEGDLLIVDEAQHLKPDALDALRYFNDACGVGIAYLGNEKVYRDIHDPGKASKFAQLDSRFGKRLRLTVPSEADIDAILAAWNVVGIAEREFGISMGARDGGIRSLCRVLDIAWKLARDSKTGRISIDHLCAAAEETGDMEVMS